MGWLVEDIKNTGKIGAELGRQANPLGFAPDKVAVARSRVR